MYGPARCTHQGGQGAEMGGFNPVQNVRAQVREASRARIAYQWGDLALTAQ